MKTVNLLIAIFEQLRKPVMRLTMWKGNAQCCQTGNIWKSKNNTSKIKPLLSFTKLPKFKEGSYVVFT